MTIYQHTPKSRPRPERPAPDPRTIHLRHHAMGGCRGCAAPRHRYIDTLYLDDRHLYWHYDCWQIVMQTACPAYWQLPPKVLPFTG